MHGIISNWQFADIRLESLGMTFVTMYGNSALQRYAIMHDESQLLSIFLIHPIVLSIMAKSLCQM